MNPNPQISNQAAFKIYLSSIEKNLNAGNATEHTHRPALKTLIETIANKDDIHATNEPRRIACGAPDYIIARGTLPLGYIEAKDVGVDLLKTERSDQLKRYRDSLSNLVLTDYLSFRWYTNGELRLSAELPRPGRDGKIRWDSTALSPVEQLLQQFLTADMPFTTTPKELATSMAGLARLIRDLIQTTFQAEKREGDLHLQLAAFRQVLIESLTPEQFADMYAQTLSYGLFAARCNTPDSGFTRQSAATSLPKTNPFLRKLFNTIAGPDLDDRIAWAVDQLALLLASANMTSILEDFGRHTRQEDPVVHFYETFLAEYDPALREARGVYYTPEPVVGYIVRSVDAILKRDFKIKDGLADSAKIKFSRTVYDRSGTEKTEKIETHRLQILDPATGTGTFLYAVIAKIREHFEGNAGAWPGYVAEHLLPRIFGFELLMAPYAVAHMKLGLVLQETGYDFSSNQRLGVFLTNSLEEAHELTGVPLFTSWLAEESRAAGDVKRDAPVMVVVGNPPYSGHSVNRGKWIESLMEFYKRSPELKKPGQAKWLSDDYVKFIRFAQWRIEQTGYGVLAFITNHAYLDNPTFKDMRESLLSTFDDIYILDLHGSAKKRESAPSGAKDENVFDIQQGVAIGIFVRKPKSNRASDHIFHADLYGTRITKYEWLDSNSLASTSWNKVKYHNSNHLFIPIDDTLYEEYKSFWSVADIFSHNGDPAPGIVTTHDQFAISWTKEEAIEKVETLLGTTSEAQARSLFKLCSQNQWNYLRAKNELTNYAWRHKVVPILYRPFDIRWTIYDRNVAVHRRERLSNHLLKNTVALISTRQRSVANEEWSNVFVTNTLMESCAISNKTKEINYGFPIRIDDNESGGFLKTSSECLNISEEFVSRFPNNQTAEKQTEKVFAYIYAILHASSYRNRYAEFLKGDFPRIPITSDQRLFARLTKLGSELIEIHTMEKTLPRITKYDVPGTNEVEKVKFEPHIPISRKNEPTTGQVFINKEQWFDNVPVAVWNMHIGGYRVAEKWLKDRKGRCLSHDDIMHYHNIVAALSRTLEIQSEIDQAIEGSGGWPLT